MGGILTISRIKLHEVSRGFVNKLNQVSLNMWCWRKNMEKKQKKLPWNKNLNLDSVAIVLGTNKNKCKEVDLEGENVTKSNHVVEEAYDYTH